MINDDDNFYDISNSLLNIGENNSLISLNDSCFLNINSLEDKIPSDTYFGHQNVYEFGKIYLAQNISDNKVFRQPPYMPVRYRILIFQSHLLQSIFHIHAGKMAST